MSPTTTSIPPAAADFLRQLAKGDDTTRRLWQLEQTWEQRHALADVRDDVSKLTVQAIRTGAEVRGICARVDKLENFATTTGEHEMTAIREQVKQYRTEAEKKNDERAERRRTWTRWPIMAVGGAVLAAIGALVTACVAHSHLLGF
jgi:hypothetical protein